jgi:hypothetical protein
LENQDVTSTPSDRCTTGCTNKQENVNAGPSVEDLAAALKTLSAEDRQRLAALLLADQGKEENGQRNA